MPERFNLRLPARVEATGRERETLTCCTRDMNADGAFFDTRKPLFPKRRVSVVLLCEYTGSEYQTPRRAQNYVSGPVLRSETDGED